MSRTRSMYRFMQEEVTIEPPTGQPDRYGRTVYDASFRTEAKIDYDVAEVIASDGQRVMLARAKVTLFGDQPNLAGGRVTIGGKRYVISSTSRHRFVRGVPITVLDALGDRVEVPL